jgi:hypothetical protein
MGNRNERYNYHSNYSIHFFVGWDTVFFVIKQLKERGEEAHLYYLVNNSSFFMGTGNYIVGASFFGLIMNFLEDNLETIEKYQFALDLKQEINQSDKLNWSKFAVKCLQYRKFTGQNLVLRNYHINSGRLYVEIYDLSEKKKLFKNREPCAEFTWCLNWNRRGNEFELNNFLHDLTACVNEINYADHSFKWKIYSNKFYAASSLMWDEMAVAVKEQMELNIEKVLSEKAIHDFCES